VDKLIDIAFRAGRKRALEVRGKRTPDKERKFYLAEEARVKVVGKVIEGELKSIIHNFPSYENLTPFYQRLLNLRISKDSYKKSLGAIGWALKNLVKLRENTLKKMSREREIKYVRAYLGRCCSLLKRVGKDMEMVKEIRNVLRSFPSIKEEPTLIIAGYPNVGKSTFMRRLTGAKVKIAPYPFTTKKIQIGYVKLGHKEFQIVDVPGILDRPSEKRNKIENQAMLAISDLAHAILFILDPTQELKPQLNLLREIRSKFKVPIFIAVNKADLLKKKNVPYQEEKINFIFSATNKEACWNVFREIAKVL